MVRLEFRVNTKMLTVLTDNIIDQNHFGNIIKTSLSNSKTVAAQSETIDLQLKNQYQGYSCLSN